MRATCPSCGAGGSITLFIADADAREAILQAARLPSDVGTLVIKYIALFAPEKRHLTMDRAARLIREVCAMIIDGTEYRGTKLQAPSHVWRAALIDMLDRADLKRPIRNHNYLKAVVESKLAERTDATQTERHRARRGEARVNNAPRRIGEAMEVPKADERDPLADLAPEDQQRWMRAARERLIEEGFDARWLVEPLIRAKAGEMLEENIKRGGRHA